MFHYPGGRLYEKSKKMSVQVQRVATSKLFRLHCCHGGNCVNFETLRYESSEIKIFHTFGLALLCFLVLPHLDSVKGLLVTSAFGLGSLSKFKQLSIRD